MQWLKNAFAIERPESVEPTARQAEVVDRICHEIVRRQLTTPALAFFEMARPLNYVSAQGLHFISPFVSLWTAADGHRELAAFLERRGSIDYICRRIEQLEKNLWPQEVSGERADERGPARGDGIDDDRD